MSFEEDLTGRILRLSRAFAIEDAISTEFVPTFSIKCVLSGVLQISDKVRLLKISNHKGLRKRG